VPNTCEHCCTKIDNLGVSFGCFPVLQGVSLHLNCHEILAVIGPNGAGKTTLLRAIAGEVAYSGRIKFLIRSDPSKKPRFGYVPQKVLFDLDSPVSVLDLVATTITDKPIWVGIGASVRRQAQQVLEKVAADDLIDKKIGELSGGQLQRVLLAMALTPVPDLLLLDEPVSAVDVKGAALFYSVVDSLKKGYDISIIMATHNLNDVAPFADRMILLNHTIISEGTPHEVLSDRKTIEMFQKNL